MLFEGISRYAGNNFRGNEYVVDLGMFLPADRFGKVKNLAGKAGGTDLAARYDLVSGKARFDADGRAHV